MAQVKIPTPLRSFTQNQGELNIPGSTVGEVLKNLDQSYPGIGGRLMDEKGGVKRYVNVFYNGDDIRFLKELDTPVKDGDQISIIPAIAGG